MKRWRGESKTEHELLERELSKHGRKLCIDKSRIDHEILSASSHYYNYHCIDHTNLY